METQNRLVPNPHVVDIKQRALSGARDPNPMPDHLPRVVVPARQVSITSGCKTQQGLGW